MLCMVTKLIYICKLFMFILPKDFQRSARDRCASGLFGNSLQIILDRKCSYLLQT